MDRRELRKKATELRRKGKTYSEIQNILNVSIPQGTLSYWCSNIKMSLKCQERIKRIISKNAKKHQIMALAVNHARREEYLKSVVDRNKHLAVKIKNKDTAKIALAMLYLGDGSKSQRGSVMFGNSNPFIVALFLYLLRYCYDIDKSKFRCTVQCRADQDVKRLEKFWSGITKISLSQFYKTRIDSRTIGKKTRKSDYKGVCRIDYFSADIFLEIMKIPEIIYKNTGR